MSSDRRYGSATLCCYTDRVSILWWQYLHTHTVPVASLVTSPSQTVSRPLVLITPLAAYRLISPYYGVNRDWLPLLSCYNIALTLSEVQSYIGTVVPGISISLDVMLRCDIEFQALLSGVLDLQTAVLRTVVWVWVAPPLLLVILAVTTPWTSRHMVSTLHIILVFAHIRTLKKIFNEKYMYENTLAYSLMNSVMYMYFFIISGRVCNLWILHQFFYTNKRVHAANAMSCEHNFQCCNIIIETLRLPCICGNSNWTV